MPGVSLLSLAELHAQTCVECANWPSDLARLHAGFDQLRACSSQMQAPARVENNLLAAFRQSTTANRSLVGTSFGRFVLAAAAVLLLVVGITLYATLRPKPAITAQRERVGRGHKGAEVIPQQRALAPFAGQAAQINRKRVRARANHARPADNLVARGNQASEQMLQQIRVLPGEQFSLNGGSNVIRVNLPLSSLATVGIPMYADLPDRQVTADVALDPFGAIIAIRLVGTKPGEGTLAN
jgi:hypothetical protein